MSQDIGFPKYPKSISSKISKAVWAGKNTKILPCCCPNKKPLVFCPSGPYRYGTFGQT